MGVELGWGLVTLKVVAYDLHHFHPDEIVHWELVHCGWGWSLRGRDHSHIRIETYRMRALYWFGSGRKSCQQNKCFTYYSITATKFSFPFCTPHPVLSTVSLCLRQIIISYSLLGLHSFSWVSVCHFSFSHSLSEVYIGLYTLLLVSCWILNPIYTRSDRASHNISSLFFNSHLTRLSWRRTTEPFLLSYRAGGIWYCYVLTSCNSFQELACTYRQASVL